jgi:hypothetical protein
MGSYDEIHGKKSSPLEVQLTLSRSFFYLHTTHQSHLHKDLSNVYFALAFLSYLLNFPSIIR